MIFKRINPLEYLVQHNEDIQRIRLLRTNGYQPDQTKNGVIK